MEAYIKGAAVISPQKTFGDHGFPDELISFSGPGFMKCIEPVYRDFIDPMVARRMSRIVKMGVCSALKCMRDSGISQPDAIITGTGLGCLEDTGKFLTSVYTNEEKLLNPTPFIQSTHNTVAGAIALAIKCHNYNATYTQRGFSFESAAEDALMQIEEDPGKNILVGGFDEITETSYALTKRLGLWKNHPVESDKLYGYQTRGSLAGEGAAFFMLGGKKEDKDKASIRLLKTFYSPEAIPDINSVIKKHLDDAGISPAEIGLVIAGINGDNRTDYYYHDLMKGLFSRSAVAGYKHLCGEYDTSVSFAVWLAWYVICTQYSKITLLNENIMPGKIDRILIYNHLRGRNHSLYLVERC